MVSSGSSPRGAPLPPCRGPRPGSVLRHRPGEPPAHGSPRCPPLAAGARLGLAPARMAQGRLPPETPRTPRTGAGVPCSRGSVHGRCFGSLLPQQCRAQHQCWYPAGHGDGARSQAAALRAGRASPAACRGQPWSLARPTWLLPQPPSCSFSKSILWTQHSSCLGVGERDACQPSARHEPPPASTAPR